MATVKFAIPKGSLEKATFDILQKAWYEVRGQDRTYRPQLSDPEIETKILRPQEIPIFVAEGLQDVGITGKDWIRETRAQVDVMLDLNYGSIKLVAAIPEQYDSANFNDYVERLLKEGRKVRISTEYLNLASDFVQGLPAYKSRFGASRPTIITPWWRQGENDRVRIYLSFGATEAKPPEDADAIVDVVETGSTLKANKLKPVEVISESSAVLIANRNSVDEPAKREKIFDIITLLKGVVDSKRKLHIFVNVRRENLNQLLDNLPALKRPTVSPLSDQNWFSVNTVIDKDEFLKLLPLLRRLAQGLVVHEPQQILSLEEIAREEGNDK